MTTSWKLYSSETNKFYKINEASKISNKNDLPFFETISPVSLKRRFKLSSNEKSIFGNTFTRLVHEYSTKSSLLCTF